MHHIILILQLYTSQSTEIWPVICLFRSLTALKARMKELVNTNEQIKKLVCSTSLFLTTMRGIVRQRQHRQYELPTYDLNTKC